MINILCSVALMTLGGAMAEKTAAPLTGREIVDRAIEAAGGETWRRPKTLQLSGSMVMMPGGRADKALTVDDYRMWRVFPAASDAAHTANGKVRFDAKAAGKTVFQISFDGNNTYDQNGLVEENSADARWAANFGFGIIRFTQGLDIHRLADDVVEGHEAFFIEVTDAEGEGTIFGIDKDDYAIRYVGFDTERGWHHRTYSDFAWHENPRFRQPRRVKLFYDGRKTNDIQWPDFIVNGEVPNNLFVLEGAE